MTLIVLFNFLLKFWILSTLITYTIYQNSRYFCLKTISNFSNRTTDFNLTQFLTTKFEITERTEEDQTVSIISNEIKKWIGTRINFGICSTEKNSLYVIFIIKLLHVFMTCSCLVQICTSTEYRPYKSHS